MTLPVHIPQAELTAVVFRADAGEARDILADVPLEPLIVGGHAYSLLMCIHYEEWALHSYDEVGVGLLARGPGLRPGLYLSDLPVTGELTREAGRDFWGLPKWLMRCDLAFSPAGTAVTVHDGADQVMRATITHGNRGLPFPLRSMLPSWSYLDEGAQAGRLLRGRVPMHVSGVTMGRGTVDLELGDHPMAGRMRALGMLGKPLFTMHADRLTGPLGEFRRVSVDRSRPSRRP